MKTLGEAVTLSKSLPAPGTSSGSGQISEKTESRKVKPHSPQEDISLESFLMDGNINKYQDFFIHTAFYLHHYRNKDSFSQKELLEALREVKVLRKKFHSPIENNFPRSMEAMMKMGAFKKVSDGRLFLKPNFYEELLSRFNLQD